MAKQRKTDNEDELKRKQRRRLIGAVALFTALVVIVPMVLDRTPQTTNMDIDLRIPDKDQAGEFKSQMVLPESINTTPPDTAPAGTPADGAAQQPNTAATSAPAATPTTPAPTPKPAPQTTTKPSAANPAGTHHSTRVMKEGFAVQVGAFSNVNTALELRDKLRNQGLPAYTEKSGNITRVRVGAYPTRKAAEDAAHQLQAQGLKPTVVGAAS
jgi:DedD protein